jgi:hypothetical protein
VDLHPVAGEFVEGALRGVPVAVVGTDGDQRHPCAGGGEEVGVGVGAAVVRHLQHVGPHVDAPVEDAPLGLGVEVAGEQHPHPALGEPDQHAEVVGLRGRGGRRGRRGEDLHGRRPQGAPVPRQQGGAGGARLPGELVDAAHPVVGRGQHRGGDHADGPPAQSAGQAGHVVGVEVGQQHQRHVGDPQPTQAGVLEGRVRSDVDEHCLARGGRHDERVALADVAGDQVGGRRRPAPERLPHRPADHDEGHERGQRQPAQPFPAPQRHAGGEEDQPQQQRSGPPRRPGRGGVGDGGRPVRHHDHPAHRPTGHPEHCRGRTRRPRGEQRGHQAQHRGRGDRRSREQVGRQRHQRQPAGEARDRRRGDQAGGRTHRQGVGQQRGTAVPAQRGRPPRGQQHDARRGRHRERETDVLGEGRTRQQEHGHRGRERGDGGAGTARGEAGDPHDPHGRGAQHAGPRPHQDDECGERQHRDERLHPAVDHPAAQRPEDPRQDDGHVRARDGDQVGEPGGPEVGLEQRVERTGVAEGQARQQTADLVPELLPCGTGEAVAHAPRGLLQPAGTGEAVGWSARGQQRHDLVRRGCSADGRPDPHLLPRQHSGPVLGGAEDDDRIAHGHRPVGQLQPERGRVHHDPGRAGGPGHRSWVAVHLQHGRHDAAGHGGIAQR